MKTHKILTALAAIGLAIGLAGCSSSAPKAASEPAHKIPTAAQMSQEKQAELIERNVKAAKDYVAKVKAEKEAQAKAEAEAAAQAEAQAQAQTQAQAGAQAGGQTQARSGGNYRGRSNYQAPRRSGGNYQAPRSGGNSGGGSEWKVGESQDYGGARWTRTSENEVRSRICGDTEGNTWPC